MRTSAVQRDPVRQEHNSYNVTESLEDSNQMGPAPSIMARLIPRVNDLVPTDDELASVPNDDVTSFENPADKSEVLGDQGDQVRNMSKVTAVPQGSNDSAIQVSSVADKKSSRDQPLGHQSDAEATTTDDSMPFPAMDDNSSRSDFPSTSLSTLPRTNSEAATLKILSDFLTSQEGIAQHLDEEKVVAYTHSIHRDAKDRTRLRKNLVEDFEVLTDRDAVYDRIYSEEEHLATASHMFHEIVDFASLKAAVRLDSRTLKWLKRATGLHKNNNLLDQNNDGFSDLEEGETEGSARRMTRGVKKERQKQRMRKETEGLSIFIDVIKEIEKERGLPVVLNTQFVRFSLSLICNAASYQIFTFSYFCFKLKYPTSEEDTTQDESAYDEADNYIDRRIASGFCVRDYPPKSELIARIQSRLLSVRLIFRGNVISRANRMELVSAEDIFRRDVMNGAP